MKRCLSCLEPSDDTHHPRCLRQLFGTSTMPAIDVELSKLHRAGLEMVGQVALSGVQQKIALGLSSDRKRLEVKAGARYILKPQIGTYPHVPENEHVTMHLAELVGLEVPQRTLVRLNDGSLAYLVERFDRPRQGGKLAQEDFCQLAGLSPKDKYTGSIEACVKLVRRFSSEPLVDLLALYRQFAFVWWTGNGDAHLKNFSVLVEDGRARLSPAYDQVSTELVIEGDPLAMTVKGRKSKLTPATWLYLAGFADLPGKPAAGVLETFVERVGEAEQLIDRCLLPGDMKATYVDLVRKRARVFAEGAAKLRARPSSRAR